MSLTKCLFDFHLMEDGWLSSPPYNEGEETIERPADCIVTLRMVEYSSDDRPDIWYKAEIIHRSSNDEKIKELLGKYGLPKAIVVNCPSDTQHIEEHLFFAF